MIFICRSKKLYAAQIYFQIFFFGYEQSVNSDIGFGIVTVVLQQPKDKIREKVEQAEITVLSVGSTILFSQCRKCRASKDTRETLS